MKKYIALAWVCLALTDVMAQKQKVVEKVVDEDYYPVEGAVVTLKRTNQNAMTDKDGVFILEEVPVYFDSLQVKYRSSDAHTDAHTGDATLLVVGKGRNWSREIHAGTRIETERRIQYLWWGGSRYPDVETLGFSAVTFAGFP